MPATLGIIYAVKKYKNYFYERFTKAGINAK
jgi:hypothetical protein